MSICSKGASTYVCSRSTPRAVSEIVISEAKSLARGDQANDPHTPVPSVWRQGGLNINLFEDTNRPPLNPGSPPPSYTHGSPSARHPLVQNPSSPPSSYTPHGQTSYTAMTDERPDHRPRTSTQLKSKSSSGTLVPQSQGAATMSRPSQPLTGPLRRGTGEPSSSASPLSSRTGTSSYGSKSKVRRTLKCRSGEHDFERKFGVSCFASLLFPFRCHTITESFVCSCCPI